VRVWSTGRQGEVKTGVEGSSLREEGHVRKMKGPSKGMFVDGVVGGWSR
jgi:hypothetical protein